MKQLVIMPGGFHPFHAGHLALYQAAKQAFPGADVYVAATNDTSERPFPFALKEKLAKLAGIESGHFVQVKSPFRAEEITKNYDPKDTELIFVRSEKDAAKPPQAGGNKKDGSPAYLQPLTGQDVLLPMNRHAYMAYLPTVEFGPGMTSATEIRKAWPTLNDRRKTALVMSLYPRTQKNPKLAATVVKMLDTAIGEQLNEFLPALGAALGGELAAATELGTMGTLGMRLAGHKIGSDIEDQLNITNVDETRIIDPKRIDVFYRPVLGSRGKRVVAQNVPATALDALLAKLSQKFGVRDTDFEWSATDPKISEDYVEEKWSQKYKKSINCAHPKGFSQKAHCAGRKK
jgi:Cytidylyltransferase-like